MVVLRLENVSGRCADTMMLHLTLIPTTGALATTSADSLDQYGMITALEIKEVSVQNLVSELHVHDVCGFLAVLLVQTNQLRGHVRDTLRRYLYGFAGQLHASHLLSVRPKRRDGTQLACGCLGLLYGHSGWLHKSEALKGSVYHLHLTSKPYGWEDKSLRETSSCGLVSVPRGWEA